MCCLQKMFLSNMMGIVSYRATIRSPLPTDAIQSDTENNPQQSNIITGKSKRYLQQENKELTSPLTPNSNDVAAGFIRALTATSSAGPGCSSFTRPVSFMARMLVFRRCPVTVPGWVQAPGYCSGFPFLDLVYLLFDITLLIYFLRSRQQI